jgi:membrane protein YqaA with SNARE-associated domain
MKFASAIFALVLRYGGAGLLVLGILDSSYLFVPWGNDLLLVALVARHRSLAHVLYYAGMSTAGSVLGCLIIDLTLRPLGAKGLERHLPARRIKRIQDKVTNNAGQALALASLAPPPFPFTAFVMGAAALQYPRKRLLGVIAVTRMVRFVLVGLLARHFGAHILAWMKKPVVQGFLIALIVVCTVGSIISAYGWIKRSRSGSREPARAHAR